MFGDMRVKVTYAEEGARNFRWQALHMVHWFVHLTFKFWQILRGFESQSSCTSESLCWPKHATPRILQDAHTSPLTISHAYCSWPCIPRAAVHVLLSARFPPSLGARSPPLHSQCARLALSGLEEF